MNTVRTIIRLLIGQSIAQEQQEQLSIDTENGLQINKWQSGQAVLDFILVFIAIGVLTIGIVRIWTWFSANYAGRNLAYQRSRLTAATPKDNYNTPIDIGAEEPGGRYQPLDLTEDWVFRGIPERGLDINGDGEIGDYEPEKTECQRRCRQPQCFDDITHEYQGDCPCMLRCICMAQIRSTVDLYEDQARMLRRQARQLENSARQMRRAAERCDDPWELCWWGDWGKTPSELRKAARQLDDEARSLRQQANILDAKGNELRDCCNDPDGDGDPSNNTVAMQEACFGLALGADCQDIVDDIIALWENTIGDSEARIQDLNDLLNEINIIVPQCNNDADVYCEQECTDLCTDASGVLDEDCYNDCMQNEYPFCYEQERNDCCRNNCCQGESWGRSCDEPSWGCDDDCLIPGICPGCDTDPDLCVDCGLTELANRIPGDIQELEDEISQLQDMIDAIEDCCNFSTPQEQRDCMWAVSQGGT
jgi:prefoldin subunit 5